MPRGCPVASARVKCRTFPLLAGALGCMTEQMAYVRSDFMPQLRDRSVSAQLG
jgi:hypothetical protein